MAYRYKFYVGKKLPDEQRTGKSHWANMLDLDIPKGQLLEIAEQLIRRAQLEGDLPLTLVGQLVENEDD